MESICISNKDNGICWQKVCLNPSFILETMRVQTCTQQGSDLALANSQNGAEFKECE